MKKATVVEIIIQLSLTYTKCIAKKTPPYKIVRKHFVPPYLQCDVDLIM